MGKSGESDQQMERIEIPEHLMTMIIVAGNYLDMNPNSVLIDALNKWVYSKSKNLEMYDGWNKLIENINLKREKALSHLIDEYVEGEKLDDEWNGYT